jgi:hypothetical protein
MAGVNGIVVENNWDALAVSSRITYSKNTVFTRILEVRTGKHR